MKQDLNDLLRAGKLSADPLEGIEIEPAPPADPEASEVAELPPLDKVKLSGFIDTCTAQMMNRHDGRELPLASPWEGLNKALCGGLWPGLVVMTGNTGSGKTQFALQLAMHAARAGHPALYVGLEMDKLGLVARLMALEYRHKTNVRIPWADLYRGRDPWGRDPALPTLAEVIEATRPALVDLPLYLEEGPPGGWFMADARDRLAELPADCPSPLVVVDFLQLVGGPGHDLRERIGTVAYEARELARRHNAIMLLVSSTARENYPAMAGLSTKGKTGEQKKADPFLGEGDASRFVGLGKESGEIEYAADLVLALCRERQEDRTVPPVHVALAKQRAGVPTWCKMAFDGCYFDDASDDNPLTDPPAKAGGGRHDRQTNKAATDV